MRAEDARPPRTPARRRGKSFGSRKFSLVAVFNRSFEYTNIAEATWRRESESRIGTGVQGAEFQIGMSATAIGTAENP
jgi:hypothetical protein